MPSPFPGMDPYLEAPAIWPDLHDALASEIRNELNQTLPTPYYARLEMRPELGIVEERKVTQRIVPDITVVRHPLPRPAQGATAVVDRPRREISSSIDIVIHIDKIRHHFIEIRDSLQGHKLITLIEILSPSNKRSGPDRDAYRRKQHEVLESDANLIEIDLLRSGDRVLPDLNLAAMLDEVDPAPDYVVLVNRAWRRAESVGYEVFPFSLREWLPCIPVPLKQEESEVPLDLQYVFNRAYDGGPYRRGAVDYARPPSPSLSEADAAWAELLLRDRN
ncbi:DUF4058 family protein [Singulisphaera acidiphila]|uniref:DUF4058 domain-containing protein n=1 Tax=Singulisphaera acidiphila (strain ATCC BAA-1392 / DSM 18658 / VKM B-2454 / MOB10) TaxID=886293 RepID=L0D5C4_SINAD|nr:DUF4058 family protein [Singulisphaera acidiphila]AGA24634.1 hypothetical protein Sinac_0183 [Singulisphaera acidiphila DSM 18658]